MLVIGLTGNYGMGKSTVAKMFRELGAASIDTDHIVRELFEDPAVIYEIKKLFGDELARGGAVDKARLADVVFRNPHLRIALEDILHPRVFRKVDEELEKLSHDSADVVVIEATVIFERGYQNRFDKIITVHAPEETAIRRLEEKGVPGHKALERLKSQFPSEMKTGKSDFTIDNGKDLEHTAKQVKEIYRELLMAEKRYGSN